MDAKTLILELLLAGFFAVACIKGWDSLPADQKIGFGDLLRFPNRIERLRRSRWQWFSMVALLLVLRLQHELPLILEVTVVLQFIMFTILPSSDAPSGVGRVKHSAAVGKRV